MKRKVIPILITAIIISTNIMTYSEATPLTLNGENYWIILDEFSNFNLTIDDPNVCSTKDITDLSFERCSDLTNQSFQEQYTYNLDDSFNRTYYNITIDFKYKYDRYWDIGRVEIAFMHRNESVFHENENIVVRFRMIRSEFDNSTTFYCASYDGNSLRSFGRIFTEYPPLHGITFIAIQNETTTYRAIKKAVHDELLVHSTFNLAKNQSIDYIVVNYWTSEINGNFNATLTNFNLSLVDPYHIPEVIIPTSTSPTVKIGYSGLIVSIVSLNIMIIISLCRRKNKLKEIIKKNQD
ncbi:MAG: hypothetical protein FK733_06070 [Asgard group archaeon]|nr:hypothetical protein [Asgard group archaeon]